MDLVVAGAHLALSVADIFGYYTCPVCGRLGLSIHLECFERLVEGGVDGNHLWFWKYSGRGAEIIRRKKSKLDAMFFYLAGSYMAKFARRFGVGVPQMISYVSHHPFELRAPFSIPFLLALGMSDEFGVRLSHIFKKTRRTEKQKFLDKKARKLNVKGAFEVLIYAPSPDTTMWIVDDVYTTGATLNELASVASSAGFNNILLVTLAKTPSSG